MNENVEPIDIDNDDSSEDGKRQRSTIAFPYTDYGSIAEIVSALHENVGHGECSVGQLAAWTNQSPKSSGYRTQLSAARLFGLIESGSESGSMKLTELGRRSLDPNQARAAKAQAFLNVPLFNALYDLHKDGVTPPSAALEREIASLGVAEKQKARARQVFESSAQQTGFREASASRLVKPAVVIGPEKSSEKPKSGGTGSGDGSDLGLDPLIMALLRKIPKDPSWPAENRLRWFRTFAMNVSQVYDEDSQPIELKIELVKQNGSES